MRVFKCFSLSVLSVLTIIVSAAPVQMNLPYGPLINADVTVDKFYIGRDAIDNRVIVFNTFEGGGDRFYVLQIDTPSLDERKQLLFYFKRLVQSKERKQSIKIGFEADSSHFIRCDTLEGIFLPGYDPRTKPAFSRCKVLPVRTLILEE